MNIYLITTLFAYAFTTQKAQKWGDTSYYVPAQKVGDHVVSCTHVLIRRMQEKFLSSRQ